MGSCPDTDIDPKGGGGSKNITQPRRGKSNFYRNTNKIFRPSPPLLSLSNVNRMMTVT